LVLPARGLSCFLEGFGKQIFGGFLFFAGLQGLLGFCFFSTEISGK